MNAIIIEGVLFIALLCVAVALLVRAVERTR